MTCCRHVDNATTHCKSLLQEGLRHADTLSDSTHSIGSVVVLLVVVLCFKLVSYAHLLRTVVATITILVLLQTPIFSIVLIVSITVLP